MSIGLLHKASVTGYGVSETQRLDEGRGDTTTIFPLAKPLTGMICILMGKMAAR